MIPKGQSRTENPEKLVTLGTHKHQTNTKNTQKHNTICVGHHYTQASTNNANKT